MFTDIVGFTRLSERLPPEAVAELLNQHFTQVAHAVEAEGGTVDKFIGDGLMAFWGAPEKLKNRAARACRAALAIRAAIEAEQQGARGGRPAADPDARSACIAARSSSAISAHRTGSTTRWSATR